MANRAGATTGPCGDHVFPWRMRTASADAVSKTSRRMDGRDIPVGFRVGGPAERRKSVVQDQGPAREGGGAAGESWKLDGRGPGAYPTPSLASIASFASPGPCSLVGTFAIEGRRVPGRVANGPAGPEEPSVLDAPSPRPLHAPRASPFASTAGAFRIAPRARPTSSVDTRFPRDEADIGTVDVVPCLLAKSCRVLLTTSVGEW